MGLMIFGLLAWLIVRLGLLEFTFWLMVMFSCAAVAAADRSP